MKNQPRVICHMASTVDGRIIVDNWGDSYTKLYGLYEQCHNSFDSDAWMVGRVTMEKNFTDGKKPELAEVVNPISRAPFVGNKEAQSFAIAIDEKGKLGWEENEIEGDHLIEVLAESVSDSYLHYLQNKKISYVFGGKNSIDFELVLQQLNDLFNIKTLMHEGGGSINGSLLNAGLIDELSLLLLPIADGMANTATLFDISPRLAKKYAKELNLKQVQQLDHGVLWLKYEFINKK